MPNDNEHQRDSRRLTSQFIGTKRDAIWYALGANTGHGLQLSSADKRRAVEIALDDAEWAALSNRDLAKHCGCTHTTVKRIREQQSGAEGEGGETAVEHCSTAQPTDESSRISAHSETSDDIDEGADEEDAEEDPMLGHLQREYRELCSKLSDIGGTLKPTDAAALPSSNASYAWPMPLASRPNRGGMAIGRRGHTLGIAS